MYIFMYAYMHKLSMYVCTCVKSQIRTYVDTATKSFTQIFALFSCHVS